MNDKAINGILALIEKDCEKVCELSDYECIKYSAPDAKLLCGSEWCKDKLLQDILSMGEGE